jgi:hypothetical protein
MEHKDAAPVNGYLLSVDGFHELTNISAQLRLMAQITYGSAAENGNNARLLIRRDLMGWYFEEIGAQIDEVLSAVTPAADELVPPLH